MFASAPLHLFTHSRIAAVTLGLVLLWSGVSSSAQPLSAEERVFGLSRIWQAASTDFANFEPGGRQVWDETYLAFLPRVLATGPLVDYYRLLQEFCATLGDGHTTVFAPPACREQVARPNVLVRCIEDRPIVCAVGESLRRDLPVGSRILAVDGVEVEQYLQAGRLQRVSASSDRQRREIAIIKLLEGPVQAPVEIAYETPEGRRLDLRLIRASGASGEPLVNTYPRTEERLAHEELEEGIAYLALNTFADPEIIADFARVLPRLRQSAGVVVDLRRNGGGESDIAFEILSHLISRPVVSYAWKTRKRYSAHAARGRWTSEWPAEDLADLDAERQEYLDHYRGEAWLAGEPEIIQPADAGGPPLRLAVLIGPMTGSAAEDFLVPLVALDEATLLGQTTAGFTGTPLVLDLPGGGVALINTTREYFPDGEEIHGGIRPDVRVEPTVGDNISGRDAALERAVALLTGRP